MGSGAFSNRFVIAAACLLTLPLAVPLATPCRADMPPLGYVGPVPNTFSPQPEPTPTNLTPPPVGYIGPVPRASEGASVSAAPVSTVAPVIVPIQASGQGAWQATQMVPAVSDAVPQLQPQPPMIPLQVRQVSAPDVTRAVSPAHPPPPGYTGPVPPSLGYAGPLLPDSGKPAFLPQFSPYADDIKKSHSNETLITAKQMHSDAESGVTSASGKVEIVHNDYVLHADKVIYDQKADIMTADGHVAMLTPSGEVQYADHEEITGDMKQAVAKKFGILFPDNSRMAGLTGQRYDERYTVVDKAIYTACNVCLEHPDIVPLWQLRAVSITHDNVEHQVYYHDATIDFMGTPVLYTPYVSAPDPTVTRRQGFLAPEPGLSPNIGAYVKTPYYVDIAPDKDMTITPTFSVDDKLQLDTQYRERFDRGKLNLEGSITHADLINDNGFDEGQQWRGHVFGNFLYDIDNTWRAGTDIQYASDKSYLERYNLSSLDQTTSRAFIEGLHGRDYAVVNSYYFQDLRPGTDSSQPVIPPSAQVSLLGDPGQTLGGRWSFDGNTLITSRDNTGQPLAQQGPDTRRLSMDGGWERQFVSNTGLETTVSGLLRTDSYWANNIVASDGSGDVYKNAMFTRQFEQANVVARYPMGRSGTVDGAGYQQLLEPIVALTAAPNVRQISEQPIEDSLDAEFDETNLFSPNRFTGSDLVEGGSRVTYGARNAITTDSGAKIDIFGGQSYDFSSNDQFPDQSGLQTLASDYVGRIDFEPAPWLTANYGFRLAESDLTPQQQDALVSVGAPVFRPFARYIEAYESDTTTGLIDQVKEVTLGFSSKVTKFWTLSGSHIQAFDPQPGPRDSRLTLSYVDECFAFGVTAAHNDTNRLDISSGTSVAFHVYLKNLGGANTDSTSNISFPAEFRQTTQ
jgi:LPS-assembly protein